MKTMIVMIVALASAASHAADTPEQTAQFKQLRGACVKLNDYSAFKKEVTGNYETLARSTLGGFIPSGTHKDNAAMVMVNPKKWDDMSPKDQVEITNAAYMVEVCDPKRTTLPVILIADWKTHKPLATRRGFRISAWSL